VDVQLAEEAVQMGTERMIKLLISLVGLLFRSHTEIVAESRQTKAGLLPSRASAACIIDTDAPPERGFARFESCHRAIDLPRSLSPAFFTTPSPFRSPSPCGFWRPVRSNMSIHAAG
ncbi:MAG: hypothetical protein O6951_05320, partial [Actinobacteria bacterium]|nr:hypothetical protein [Actinomycetota bacterium]